MQGYRMVNSRLRKFGFKIWDRDSTSRAREKKTPVEAGGGPPIYFFVLFYCLNLLNQFDKLYQWTLKHSTPKDQTERKNDKSETPRPVAKKNTRLWDPIKNANPRRFRDGAKIFSETHVFRGTFPYYLTLKAKPWYNSFMMRYKLSIHYVFFFSLLLLKECEI